MEEFDCDAYSENTNALIMCHRNIRWERMHNHMTHELRFGTKVKMIVTSVPSVSCSELRMDVAVVSLPKRIKLLSQTFQDLF